MQDTSPARPALHALLTALRDVALQLIKPGSFRRWSGRTSGRSYQDTMIRVGQSAEKGRGTPKLD
ncbi:hypothetical protein ACIPSA_48110 [Streptomyces sp. NPDC086549]|uniref:hypothetical protein n=1 Tax=Streptomyces sp. NPDC086549 TaxID=3365752 RepID=UPI0038281DB3